MRIKYYALTDAAQILYNEVDYYWDYSVFRKPVLAEIHKWVPQTDSRVIKDTLKASELPNATLLLFKTWDAATGYAKASRFSDDIEVRQSAIVEIYVDEAVPLQEVKAVADAKQPVYQMDNKPQNYVSYCSWIGDRKLALHTETTKEFAGTSIYKLFHEYHSPPLFSCHWRHHKKSAKAITDFMDKESDPRKIYEFIFKLRQNLMSTDNELAMQGGFMRRIQCALKSLRDAKGDELEVIDDLITFDRDAKLSR